ncbi:MAG TPA: ABC transporter substrate-binding protein, partial [Dehalococcoidia bacterium]|nr:ABC transporter substrate-binding protein [Dehalococcoidia bacterium]
MDSNYWSRKLQTRLSRRRAMLGTAGGALGAALLAACGGSDNNNKTTTSGSSGATSGASGSSSGASGASGGSGAKSGLLATPVDTTKQAVKGGTLNYYQNADPPTMDPFTSSSSLTQAFNEGVYQRLLRWSVGTPEKPPQTVEGDLAESYEVSPDGLTLTFKMRQGNKWDQRAPTNGRAVSTDDVKWSWDAFVAGSNPGRGSMAHSVNPQAPIDSFSFPDDKTVVVKLVAPNSGILAMLTFNWYLSILPTELQDNNPTNFNRKFDMRGSGPFMLTKAQGSVGYEFQRNPNYWRTDRPFLDGFTWPTIPESAQVLAQFKAGRIWYYSPQAEQVLQLKNESPQLNMYAISPFVGNLGGSNLNTSKLPDQPFNDVRIRYALSMLIDRDGYNEAFGNISKFEAAGIPM